MLVRQPFIADTFAEYASDRSVQCTLVSTLETHAVFIWLLEYSSPKKLCCCVTLNPETAGSPKSTPVFASTTGKRAQSLCSAASPLMSRAKVRWRVY